jgi:predicted chitinase
MKLETLATVEPQPIKDLSHPQIAELQTALVLLGYPAGSADGLWGPRTRNAWGEFVEDFNCTGDPNDIDSDRAAELQKALDTVVRGPEHDFSTKDGTTKAIEDECTRHGIRLKTQIAYVLATADHETNHTFRPVTEAYWLKDPDAWLKTHHPQYYPYYGRGYVQLTWKTNYAKYGLLLNKDLVGHPDLALNPQIAVFVLVHGFKTGAFTGRKITDYIDTGKTDFKNARRCINGMNDCDKIAALAQKYLATEVSAFR